MFLKKVLFFVIFFLLNLQLTSCQSNPAAEDSRIPVFVSIEGPVLEKEESELLQKYRPVGIILFEKNCVNEKQVKALTSRLKNMGFLVAVDFEGKIVNRFRKFYPSPKNAADFRKSKLSDIYNYHYKAAKYAKYLGIDIIFGPVTDICYDPSAFMFKRSFSGNAHRASLCAETVVKAYQDAGIFPVIKHLPGHGKATDTHTELAFVDASREELFNNDIKASANVINLLKSEKRPLPGAMTSHVIYKNWDPNFPATLSKKIIQKIIRNHIGIKDGLVFSDAIDMKALVNFINGKKGTDEQNYRPVALKEFLKSGGDIAITDSIKNFKLTPEAFVKSPTIMKKISKFTEIRIQ